MFNGERPRSENLESEINPEQAAERAVNMATATVESRDAEDPVISSEWVKNFKAWIKEHREQAEQKYTEWAEKHKKTANLVRDSGTTIFLGAVGYVKFKLALFNFAMKLIQKRGGMTFGEGYEIGKDAFSFESKKDKK